MMPQFEQPFSEWSINGRFFSQRATGVQRYAAEIVRALDALDRLHNDEATVFVAQDANVSETLTRISSFKIGGPANHAWEQLSLVQASSRPILSLCNRGPIAAKRQVICIHDANVYNCPESYSLPFRLAYKTLLPLFARRSSHLVTVSRHSALELGQRFGLPSDRIHVFHNGHEHALRWRPENSDIMNSVGFERPFVLTIGSQAKHKNIGLLYGLAPELDEMGVDLVIAGGGANIFSAFPNVASNNVHVLGIVSDDDLAALLSRALCLAFPSLTEGFGLPIVEAMARGCPVVSSNAACMPEICGEAALLVDPLDADAWLRQIRLLLGSEALRNELSEKGKIEARRFSWRTSAEGYLTLMRSLN